MRIQRIDPFSGTMEAMRLTVQAGQTALHPDREAPAAGEALYLSPPWIDSHCHVFDGINFGLLPDDIGYRTGVHLLVDAGSAGVETFPAFHKYVVLQARTQVLAFLNVSAIGLVTMQEYMDPRQVRPADTAAMIGRYPGCLKGVKVRSSGTVVEAQGLHPLREAVRAAEMAGCPLMIHMGEAPPSNEANLALLRGGDILTHCFHGKQLPAWEGSPLWHENGAPVPALARALDRGVLLDVGHGEASFCAAVAAPVVARGEVDFTISTDLHGRSLHEPVHSLAVTMSKFLALGMPLAAVIRAVTALPAQRLGLTGWCDDPARNGTLFRLRPPGPDDPPFYDAPRTRMDVRQVIEPVAVIMDGAWIPLDASVIPPSCETPPAC